MVNEHITDSREPLSAPLTKEQIKARADDDNYIEGVVALKLEELIYNDPAGFLDILSERLVGTSLLMDIQYDVVGHDGNILHIKVAGDVSVWFEYADGPEEAES